MQVVSAQRVAQRLRRYRQRIGVLQSETGGPSETLSINPLIQA
jgi:hypothetical protein